MAQKSREVWVDHPSNAARHRSSTAMPLPLRVAHEDRLFEREQSVTFNEIEQPDIKPQLNWFKADPSEESLRQVATMQAKLNQRLGPEYISNRSGPGEQPLSFSNLSYLSLTTLLMYTSGGQRMSYIEAWKAIDLANDVFGYNGWNTTLKTLEVDYIDSVGTNAFNVGVTAVMRVTLKDGTFHEDTGYGFCENYKGKGAALEKAKKEATTDALKRALRTFGRLVGNCIYDKDYLDLIKKMRAKAPAFDASQLHRRTDTNAPPPHTEDELVDSHQDDSFAPASHSSMSVNGSAFHHEQQVFQRSVSAVGVISSRAPELISRANPFYGAGGCLRAPLENRSVTTGPEERRQAALRRQAAALAAKAQNPFPIVSSENLDNQADDEKPLSAVGAASAPQRPSQLRRASPAQLPLSPLQVPSAEPGAAAYARDPGVKWTKTLANSKNEQHRPSVRPLAAPAQGFPLLNEDELQAAVAVSEYNHPGETDAKVKPETVDIPVRRAESAGRFMTDQRTLSEGINDSTHRTRQSHTPPNVSSREAKAPMGEAAAEAEGDRAQKRSRHN